MRPESYLGHPAGNGGFIPLEDTIGEVGIIAITVKPQGPAFGSRIIFKCTLFEGGDLKGLTTYSPLTLGLPRGFLFSVIKDDGSGSTSGGSGIPHEVTVNKLKGAVVN
jgi:hypothetical protein